MDVDRQRWANSLDLHTYGLTILNRRQPFVMGAGGHDITRLQRHHIGDFGQ